MFHQDRQIALMLQKKLHEAFQVEMLFLFCWFTLIEINWHMS